MIFEIALLDIRPGTEAQFEHAFAEAKPVFDSARGCHEVTLYRGIEHPSRYRLMVRWTDVETHDAFRQTPGFQRWRELAGPFFAAAPVVEHVRAV